MCVLELLSSSIVIVLKQAKFGYKNRTTCQMRCQTVQVLDLYTHRLWTLNVQLFWKHLGWPNDSVCQRTLQHHSSRTLWNLLPTSWRRRTLANMQVNHLHYPNESPDINATPWKAVFCSLDHRSLLHMYAYSWVCELLRLFVWFEDIYLYVASII
jgi:hypothetical protein